MKKREKIILGILAVLACFSLFFAYNNIMNIKKIEEYQNDGTKLISGPEFQEKIPSEIAVKTKKIVFEDEMIDLTSYEFDVNKWDVSEKKDASILAYFDEDTETLTIRCDGKIIANEDSTQFFAGRYIIKEDKKDMFLNLEEIDFNNCYNASRIQTAAYMFYNCQSLKKLDLTSWKNYSLISMFYTFANCTNLEELDLSTLNTKTVNNYECIFDNCKNLKKLILGKNWKWCLQFADSDAISEYKLDSVSETWYDENGNMYEHNKLPDGAGTYYSYKPN